MRADGGVGLWAECLWWRGGVWEDLGGVVIGGFGFGMMGMGFGFGLIRMGMGFVI